MPISVRLPPHLEREFDRYCAAHNLARSEAVRGAILTMIRSPVCEASAWELGKRFLGSDPRGGDIARNTRQLLRGRVIGRVA